ncbi:class I SAM-dependent methyltransferase [Paenibacillus sp. FSL L8-0435]|uniref:class I SAM-dependent methyltransferase n=1 Tax=Paenibacillus TaxID=44249 RepID=UPI001C8DD046|nr:class I SAM-dependent methyltransferase [Paenibacillus xylanexedens]MBY0118835.1 methyltransferase domain-containing protein [Paenibacillus xylanexedens]
MLKKNHCPICQSSNISDILKRSNIPVYQNILINSFEAARQIPRGDLEILECMECGFVYNSVFDTNKVVYSSDYENTQSYSTYFNSYLDDLVDTLVNQKGVSNLNVVEVGCGKGGFLRKVVEAGNNYGFGFDPSYIGPEVDYGGRLRFEKKLYNEDSVDIKADVVLCRHVIEHIPDPVMLLKSIKKALVHSPQARVFFETPCVDWIFENKVMFDFFYEHCSYFNEKSISKAFELAGFEVISVDRIFNGQYMWLEAKSTELDGESKDKSYVHYADSSSIGFSENEFEWKRRTMEQISMYSEYGRTAIWGAGAKGVTFLNLIDPEMKYIDCVIDVNPNKVGKYLPGTGHEIVGIESLKRKDLATIIITNSNYLNEIKAIVEFKKLDINLVDLEMWCTQQE